MVTSLELAGRTIRLVRPADPDQLLDDPLVANWNRSDDYMPYWAYLWPAAYLLAEGVSREPWPAQVPESQGFQVLEIGCGLGLAGLAAVARGLRVQFTDYDQAALDFVVRSAAENGFDRSQFSIRRLDWRRLPRTTISDHPRSRRDLRGSPGSPRRPVARPVARPGRRGLARQSVPGRGDEDSRPRWLPSD